MDKIKIFTLVMLLASVCWVFNDAYNESMAGEARAKANIEHHRGGPKWYTPRGELEEIASNVVR